MCYALFVISTLKFAKHDFALTAVFCASKLMKTASRTIALVSPFQDGGGGGNNGGGGK